MEQLCALHLVLVIKIVNCICEEYSVVSDDNLSYDSYENESVDEINITKERLARVVPEGQDNHIERHTADIKALLHNMTDRPPCKHQDSIINEESEEYKSTLIGYPFSVSILRKGAHYASGALIGKRWILSSAGGFYNVRESIKLFRARLGSVDCKRHGKTVPIKSLELHPSYVYGRPNFDVALLRMAVPAAYSNVIRPIRLSQINANVLSAKFVTTYWPRIVVKGKAISKSANERLKHNSMRVSTQKLIPWDKCFKAMQILNETLDHSSLCLMPIVSHHSVCMPDIGAPVIAKDGLWGITSGWVSIKCPTTPGPTVFTRTSSSSVRAWLDAQLLDV